MNKPGGISIIICCYNSADKIESVLEHIEKQTDADLFPWEIILVDNASGDDTSEVARAYWSNQKIPLDIVYEGTPGLSAARKKGLQTSKFPIVIFVDDDNLIAENYVSHAYSIMTEHPDLGLAGGLGTPVSSIDMPAWFKNVKGAYAVGSQSEKDGYMPDSRYYLHGAGLIMRKSVWDAISSMGIGLMLTGRKGKSLSSGEDYEISMLFQLAGYRMWYDSDLRFEHILPEGRLQWPYLTKLYRAFGKTKPILDLYKSRYLKHKGLSRIKSGNWLISTLIRLKNVLSRGLDP
jgi:glycosyltransferase involved in cell wall biosynthesis